jgi:hypothetical protein
MDQSSKAQHPETTTHENSGQSRRDFVKKAVYVTPLILSFSAKPSLAQPGSACVTIGCQGSGAGAGKP